MILFIVPCPKIGFAYFKDCSISAKESIEWKYCYEKYPDDSEHVEGAKRRKPEKCIPREPPAKRGLSPSGNLKLGRHERAFD